MVVLAWPCGVAVKERFAGGDELLFCTNSIPHGMAPLGRADDGADGAGRAADRPEATSRAPAGEIADENG